MKARARTLVWRLCSLAPLLLSVGCQDRGWQPAAPETQFVLPIQAYDWERLPVDASASAQLELVRLHGDGGRLWVVGDTAVLRSKDGGRSWERLHPGSAERLVAIYARGARVWVAGFGGAILHSDDEGASWTQQLSGTDQPLYSLLGDGQRVWVVGANGTILRSEHGGLDWKKQDSGTGQGLVRIAGSGDTLWIVGHGGVILHSEDGGNHWRDQPSNVEEDLVGIYRDGERLWVIGQEGALLRTEDGGEHWRTEKGLRGRLAEESHLVAIAGMGARLWAVSEDRAFYSADGGQEWHTLPNATGGGEGASELAASEFDDVRVDGERVLLLGTWTEPLGGAAKGFVGRYALFRGSTGQSFAYLLLDAWRVRSTPPVTRLEIRFKPHPRGESGLEPPRVSFDLSGADPLDEASGFFRKVEVPFKSVAPLTWEAAFRPDTLLHARPGESLALQLTTRENDFRQTYTLRFVYLPWWERGLRLVLQYPVPVALLLVSLAALLVFALRPRWLLPLARLHESEGLREIPGLGVVVHGGLKVTRFLVHRRRVLDAWVARHAEAAGEETVHARARDLPRIRLRTLWREYGEPPVSTDRAGRSRVRATPAELRALLPGTGGILEIVGEAGIGKTTLAAKIAQWGLAPDRADRMWAQRVFPAFVDDNTTDLLETLSGRLTSLLHEEVPTDLVRSLLVRGRLLVVFDGLSERSDATQAHLGEVHRKIAERFLLLVTVRHRLDFEGGTAAELYPRPLDGPEPIRLFVEGLLRARETPAELAPALAEICQRLLSDPGPDGEPPLRSLPPLLVKMVVDRAVEVWKSSGTLDAMSDALPQVYREYLESLEPEETHESRSPAGTNPAHPVG